MEQDTSPLDNGAKAVPDKVVKDEKEVTSGEVENDQNTNNTDELDEEKEDVKTDDKREEEDEDEEEDEECVEMEGDDQQYNMDQEVGREITLDDLKDMDYKTEMNTTKEYQPYDESMVEGESLGEEDDEEDDFNEEKIGARTINYTGPETEQEMTTDAPGKAEKVKPSDTEKPAPYPTKKRITYKCSVCKHRTLHKPDMINHMKVHKTPKVTKNYRCSVCNYSSTDRNVLVKHIAVHNGGKPYQCRSCNFETTRSSHLVEHCKIHSGDKPHKCPLCDYSSARKSDLTRHNRIHTGENLYRCQHCDYTTIRNSDLVRHTRIHTGENLFRCKYCDYKSVRNSDLIRHTRTHTKWNSALLLLQLCENHFSRSSRYPHRLGLSFSADILIFWNFINTNLNWEKMPKIDVKVL